MLDQNTDRMWYVIGAVIVGAAIILIMNGTMPQIFASVGESMTDVLARADIPNNKVYLTNDDVITHGEVNDLNYHSNNWEYDAGLGLPVWMIAGFKIKHDVLTVPYGATGEIGFELWIPEGFDGVEASVDVNTAPNGVPTWTGNDNDASPLRTINGEQGSSKTIPLTAGEWNTIVVTHENTNPGNVNKVPLRDTTALGILRPEESVAQYSSVPVKIRNLYVEVIE